MHDRLRRIGATPEEIEAICARAIDHESLDEAALRQILREHREGAPAEDDVEDDDEITHDDVVEGIAAKLEAGRKK